MEVSATKSGCGFFVQGCFVTVAHLFDKNQTAPSDLGDGRRLEYIDHVKDFAIINPGVAIDKVLELIPEISQYPGLRVVVCGQPDLERKPVDKVVTVGVLSGH